MGQKWKIRNKHIKDKIKTSSPKIHNCMHSKLDLSISTHKLAYYYYKRLESSAFTNVNKSLLNNYLIMS